MQVRGLGRFDRRVVHCGSKTGEGSTGLHVAMQGVGRRGRGDAGRCTPSAGQFRVIQGEGPSGRPGSGEGWPPRKGALCGAQAGGAGAANLSVKGAMCGVQTEAGARGGAEWQPQHGDGRHRWLFGPWQSYARQNGGWAGATILSVPRLLQTFKSEEGRGLQALGDSSCP